MRGKIQYDLHTPLNLVREFRARRPNTNQTEIEEEEEEEERQQRVETITSFGVRRRVLYK